MTTASIHALPAAEARLIAQANAVADLFAQTATTGLAGALKRAQAEAQAAAARLQSAALFLGDLASGLLQEVESLTAGLAQALLPEPVSGALPQAEAQAEALALEARLAGLAAEPREGGPAPAQPGAAPCPPQLEAADREAARRRAEIERYVDLQHKATAGAASPAEEAEAAAIEERWDAETAALAPEQAPPLEELPPARDPDDLPPARGRKKRKK